MTLKEEYELKVKQQKEDAKFIKEATDYTNTYLIHGSNCDSSSNKNRRIKYVKKAQYIILQKYKKEIIELASKLCVDDIG